MKWAKIKKSTVPLKNFTWLLCQCSISAPSFLWVVTTGWASVWRGLMLWLFTRRTSIKCNSPGLAYSDTILCFVLFLETSLFLGKILIIRYSGTDGWDLCLRLLWILRLSQDKYSLPRSRKQFVDCKQFCSEVWLCDTSYSFAICRWRIGRNVFPDLSPLLLECSRSIFC